MDFVFPSVYAVHYIYCFKHVGSLLQLWNETYLVMMSDLLKMCCIVFTNILLKNFAFVFIEEIALQFPFFSRVFFCFGNQNNAGFHKEFGSTLSLSISLKSLRSIGDTVFLKVKKKCS